MASSDITKPDNPLLMDVTNLNALLKAMRKLDFSEWTDLENGTWQLDYDDQTNTVIIQVLKNGVWTKAGTLDINATSIDGFSATQAVQANTIPVRNAQGVIPGDITGNANSANTAQALSEVNPVGMGGTGADTLAGARNNLGISQLDADVEALDIATVKKTGDVMTGRLLGNMATTTSISMEMPFVAHGISGVQQIGIGFHIAGVQGASLTMSADGRLSWKNDFGVYSTASFGNLGVVGGDFNQGGRLDFLNEDYTAVLGFLDYYNNGFRFFNHATGASFTCTDHLSVPRISMTSTSNTAFGNANINLDGGNSGITVHVPNVAFASLFVGVNAHLYYMTADQSSYLPVNFGDTYVNGSLIINGWALTVEG